MYGQNTRFTNEAFIGGQTIENLGDQPVTVYSRTELKQAMAKANVEQRIKYVPGDHYLTNWAQSIDPQTLENARVLVSRPQHSSRATLEEVARLRTWKRVEPGPDIIPHGHSHRE